MRNFIYYGLITLVVILGLEIWFVVNIPSAREAGYIIWQGIATIILLGLGALLSHDLIKKKKWSKGIYYILGILIFGVVVTINYATVLPDLAKLQFYSLLALSSAIVIDIALVANTLGLEKKAEGFHISIHDRDSPIPPNMILPLWIAVFIAMGFFVTAGGSVLVSYPEFGILPGIGTPMTSGFSVGDPENIIFIFLPIAFSLFLLKKVGKVPDLAAGIAAIIIGTTAFIGYHSFVYETNVQALIAVGIFGILCSGTYYFTRSMVIPSAIHLSNNFFGAMFKKTVFGLSVIEGAGGNLAFAVFSMIAIVVLVLLVIKFFGKPSKKTGSKSRFKMFILIGLAIVVVTPITLADALLANGELCVNGDECTSDLCINQTGGIAKCFASCSEEDGWGCSDTGESPNTRGTCVGHGTVKCDITDPISMQCGAGGCNPGGDLSLDNCSITTGYACMSSVGGNFIQNGACASGAPNNCDTSGLVALSGGIYYATCQNDVDICDYNAASGGDFGDKLSPPWNELGICCSDSCVGSSSSDCCSDGDCGVGESCVGYLCTIMPQNITVYSPTNTTYQSDNISLQVSSNGTIDTWTYSLNGATNQTFSPNTTFIATEGSNIIIVYANDTIGTLYNSTVYFTVDTTPPQITVYSPTNTTYTSANITLQVSADETVDTWTYDLNGVNSTFTPNTTFIAAEGSNTLMIYANDTLGNLNSSIVYFTYTTEGNITFTNITEEYSSPATYDGTRTLQMFNVTATWNSTVQNISQVTFSFNGTNYTATDNRSIDSDNAEFYYTLNESLGVGNYTYYWFAVGSLQSNQTASQSYEVQKGSPTSLMSIASSAGWSITQGTTTVITGSDTNSGDGGCSYNLYKDNSPVTNPYTFLLPLAGTYQFRYNTSGCTNYTSGSAVATLTVTTVGGGGGGGAEEEEVLVGGENWTYVHEDFFLIIAPFDSIETQIRILNNEIADITEIEEYECIGVGDFDFCPYVIIDDTIRINGVEGDIAPGQIGEINFTIDITEEYILENDLPNVSTGLYSFSILLTINNVTKPMNVDVLVLPGGEIISDGMDWLTGYTVLVPGEEPTLIPNWFISIVVIIATMVGGAFLFRWVFRSKKGFQFIPRKKKIKFEPIDYAIMIGAIAMAIIAGVFVFALI